MKVGDVVEVWHFSRPVPAIVLAGPEEDGFYHTSLRVIHPDQEGVTWRWPPMFSDAYMATSEQARTKEPAKDDKPPGLHRAAWEYLQACVTNRDSHEKWLQWKELGKPLFEAPAAKATTASPEAPTPAQGTPTTQDAATAPPGPGRYIRIWPFGGAPPEFEKLSSNGGDEDWVAHVPAGMEIPGFLEEGGRFGCCAVDTTRLADGSHVLIGCHA